jgi:SEC-C motif-containing protein
MKCCGKLHKDVNAFALATAEQVVRARYSAYAKREVDFIVASTHPLNKNFITDIKHWKETIQTNCYDNFELTNCEIVDETYDGEGEKEIAKVKFIAKMTQVDSKEKTAFMETSLFERAGKHIANGAWLYKEVIDDVLSFASLY